MSYLFDDAASETLRWTTGIVPTTYPALLSGWFRPDDTGSYSIMGVARAANSTSYAHILTNGNGTARMFHHRYGVSGDFSAPSADSWTQDEWLHISCLVTESGGTISGSTVLNGGTPGTGSSTPTAWTLNDRIWAGALQDSTPGSYASGHIAELSIWEGVTPDGIQAALAAGYSPAFFPKNLIFYAPLKNSLIDVTDPSRTTESTAGLPTVTPGVHPPIIYPTGPIVSASSEVVVPPPASTYSGTNNISISRPLRIGL